MTTCTAAWNQKAFRGRNDNGDQATATWKANQNINWTQAVDENFRVRFEVQETAGCAGNNKRWDLQYNLNSAGWVAVTGTSNVVRSSASPNVADAANLTDQLTAGTGTFQGATGFDEVDGLAGGNSMDVAASGHAEAEFCVQILSADVVNNDAVQLRITDNGTAFAAYDATPSITVSESSPITVTPGTASLTTTAFVPTVTASDHKTVTPGTASLTLSPQTPVVTVGVKVVPGTLALTATRYAPTVSVSDNKTVTPGTASLALSPQVPTVSVSDHKTVTPGTASLSLTAFTPVVTASDHKTVTPGTASLTTTKYAPTVTASDHKIATPGTASLVLTPYAPTVTASSGSNVTVTPGTATLVLTAYAPAVAVSDHKIVTPGAASLGLATYPPTVTSTGAGAQISGGRPYTTLLRRPLQCVAYAIRTPDEWGAATAETHTATEASAIALDDLWGDCAAELLPLECVADAVNDAEAWGEFRGIRQPPRHEMLMALLNRRAA